MGAQKYQDGEYISLHCDGVEHPEFVRGHVTIEQAQAAFDSNFGAGEYTVRGVTHAYAHWGVACTEWGNQQCFFPHKEPGRGRFKVTQCEVVS